MKIRLIVYPPTEIRKLTIDSARTAAKSKYKLFFAVNGKPRLPHITICKMNVKKRDLPSLIHELQIELKKFDSIPLMVNGHRASNDGWMELSVKKNAKLTALRKSLYSILARYSDGTPLPLQPKYRPHLTYTRTKNPEDAKLILKEMLLRKTAFRANTIALTPYDKFHQVPSIIKKIKVGKS